MVEHIILNHLSAHYPAHISKDELRRMISSSGLWAMHATDALNELVGQGVIHPQGKADYYWLSRPVAYLAEIEWSGTGI